MYIKGATAHKVVNLPVSVYRINLPGSVKYKAGLFIYACYSYQYRQAAQSGSYHLKITGLKSGMYPFAPPPFFFKFREVFHLVTQLLHARIIP